MQDGSTLYLATKDHTSTTVEDDVAAGNLATVHVGPTAAQVTYDNTTSALAAADLQAAIDELTARVVALEAA